MLKFLLYPFAVILDVVTSVRNALYDRGYKPVASFDVPVISVGNLAVGGTGKTPMIEYLIRLLSPPHHLATLSRGYGRKTQGYRVASPSENADSIGDEPFQLYQKYGAHVKVVVGEERALAIPMILQEFPDTQIVLLDDAFQHRRVRPSCQIVLTDYNRLFFNDFLMPAGRLRESARGIDRADIVVVTKCPPNLDDATMLAIETDVRRFTTRPLFFSTIRYGNPIRVDAGGPMREKVVLVSGIASHVPLETYVASHYKLVRHFAFSDHHHYTDDNVREIAALARAESASVLVTEKDLSKIMAAGLTSRLDEAGLFYLPIESEFLKNGEEFDEVVMESIRRVSDLEKI